MFIQYKYILDVDFCQEKMFSFGKLLLDYKYYYFLFNYIDNKRLIYLIKLVSKHLLKCLQLLEIKNDGKN